MTRGLSYSRPLAAAAASSVLTACALLSMRLAINSRLSSLRRHADYIESGMNARIGAMSSYGDDGLEALRRRVGLFRVRLASEGTWDRIVRRLADGWVGEPATTEDRNGYSIQGGSFRLVSHAVGEWPNIVEAVKDLEAMPGVGIPEFEMKTSGSGDRRSLDTATLFVAVLTSRAESKSETRP